MEKPDLESRQPKNQYMSSRTRYGNGTFAGKTYSGEFSSEMIEENLLSAIPLFLGRWNLRRLKFPSSEVGNGVNGDPREAPPKVYNLDN